MSVVLDDIEKKKRGGELSGDIIRRIVDGYTSGKMSPAFSFQRLSCSAFLSTIKARFESVVLCAVQIQNEHDEGSGVADSVD